MKLGLGLYRRMLTPENYRFARQAGATHIVAHLLNYFSDSDSPRFQAATRTGGGFGVSDNRGHIWTYEDLRDLRAAINAEGLELEAIENFDPSHWYDVVLGGPRRREQMEDLKTMTLSSRWSAWLLCFLPIFLAVYVTFMNPGYMDVMWRDPRGHKLIALAAIMQVLGMLMVQRIIRIRI